MQYTETDEQRLVIDLPGSGGLKLYSWLRGSLDRPVVVIMHGRHGGANNTLPYLGARFLTERGFATLRLAMYGYGEGARDQFDCTLDTHVADFDAVVDYLRRQGVKTIYGVGHSYGGLTIIKSKAKLDGAALWDPSHGLAWQPPIADSWLTHARYKKVDGMLVMLNASGAVLSQTADDYDEAMGDTTQWAAGKGYPLKIISADHSHGILTELNERYIAAADTPKAHVVIDGAGHGFDESDAIMGKLFEETANWFEQQLEQLKEAKHG